ncbi:calcium-binding protein [Actinoplanes sp. NPDC051494]|uniref:calcium-binding protein n=1 Tax=Actinoplanes sp. NPDC051494 TaxID=3363907 RepID=UPI0037937F23
MARLVWLTLAAVAVSTLAAVPAQAATAGMASVSGTTVRYKAAKDKRNKVVVTRSGRTVTIDDAVAITAGKGCKKVKGDKTRVRCTTKKNPGRVDIYTYDRGDSVVNRTGLRSVIDGGTGNDRITGGPKRDDILGGKGNDKIWGLGGRDFIRPGYGDDLVHGGDGEDHIGDDGVDGVTDPPSGNDRLYGDNGPDHIFGDQGTDHLDGGAGSDFLNGGPGRDVVVGGSGDDGVFGDEGSGPFVADKVDGGTGWDTCTDDRRDRRASCELLV